MTQAQATVRLVNKYRESGGDWAIQPADMRMLARVQRELLEYQRLEPESDWHLETRGTAEDWHRWRA